MTVILQFAMLTGLRPAAVATAILTLVMFTDPSPEAVTTVILLFAMFTLLIVRGGLQQVLRAPRDVRHLKWTSAIYSVPSNIIFFNKNWFVLNQAFCIV
jgi:hypothetical protein